ncbi:hypothetical protein C8R14_10929 [Nitrosomonas eutropha]|uniref:Uncharacterized protein n=1 Tax=Nitrosomonas eutropha TaxID=916 RepID=A0ABX5MB68_9PROT|nr:hypothetical protein C8R14_10929 [Nitrosomonas eutropha]SEI81227.1 hypothetical protein SAMN05216318_11212 [Nitrosomonas eutropha]
MRFPPSYQLYGIKHKVRLAGVNFCDNSLIQGREEMQELDKQFEVVLMLFR